MKERIYITGSVRVETNLKLLVEECKEVSLKVINFVFATHDKVSCTDYAWMRTIIIIINFYYSSTIRRV